MWQKLAEINGPWGCGQGHIYIYTLHNKHENHENLMQNQQKKPEIVYTEPRYILLWTSITVSTAH